MRGHLIALLSLAAGLMASFLVIHSCDNDGATYLVVARNLLEDGTPFQLRFLSTMYAQFYEHPPLYVWLLAGLSAVLPAVNPGVLGALCGLGTVAAAYVAGRELIGERAAFFGCVVLCCTEAFFHWTPTARLDPPLVLAFTLSVALLITARGRVLLLVAGGLVAGLGALVKGPPAFGAPVAAALILAVTQRSAELKLRHVLLVAVPTLAPATLFFLYDHLALGGAWRQHYLPGQVLASALGARSDGRGHLYLLSTLAGRFWPGLPLTALALFRPRRERLALLGWAALIVGAFSAASRAFWWYALPAYIPLALLAGAGADDLLQRWPSERVMWWSQRVVLVAGVVLFAALPLGLARHLIIPCRFAPLTADAVARAPRGATVGFVSNPPNWPGQALLAEHTGRDVVVYPTLADVPASVTVVVVESESGEVTLHTGAPAGL